MMKSFLMSSVIIGFIFVSGCSFMSGRVGDVFPRETIQKIEDGRTTKQKIEALLGKPTIKVSLAKMKGEDRERYLYHFARIEGSFVGFPFITQSVSQKSEMLDIVFRGNVVESHNYFVQK